MKSSNLKRKPLKRPQVRSLKIQPRHRYNQWSTSVVPELILRGKWLEELGFAKESRVVLHTSRELIVIQPEDNQP